MELLAGIPLCLRDITEIDKHFLPKILYIKEIDANELENMKLPFSVYSASGKEVELESSEPFITSTNRDQYISLAIKYRLHEFDIAVDEVLGGMKQVIPYPIISLFAAQELETIVCGDPDISISLLRSVSTCKGISPNHPLIDWFWETLQDFSNQERSLFLRFVWGRTRLPRSVADFRGRDFVIQVQDKFQPPDDYMPESYTCFFMIKLPRYSCKAILRNKLKYAVHFCKSIDTDEHALDLDNLQDNQLVLQLRL